jgi:hypothetical protein
MKRSAEEDWEGLDAIFILGGISSRTKADALANADSAALFRVSRGSMLTLLNRVSPGDAVAGQ